MLSKYLQLFSCNMAKATSAGLLTGSNNGLLDIRHCQIVAPSVGRAQPTKSWHHLQLTDCAPLVFAPGLAVQAAELCPVFRRYLRNFSSIARPALPRPLASDSNGAELTKRTGGNEFASRETSRLIQQSGNLGRSAGVLEEVGGIVQAGKQALEPPPASRRPKQEHASVEAEKAKKPSPLITVSILTDVRSP